MRAEDHQELRELLGAYVLHQLPAPEQQTVVAHLETCAECRAEVMELEPVAAALQLLEPVGATGPTSTSSSTTPLTMPSPGPAAPVDELDRRRAARRSRIRRGGGAVLVAASVATAFALGARSAAPADPPPVVAVALNRDVPGLTADAGLVRHTWGTELKLEATGLAAGGSYTVTFVRTDGVKVSGGSFLGTGDKPVRCSVNAALALDTAAAMTITAADGTVVMNADLK